MRSTAQRSELGITRDGVDIDAVIEKYVVYRDIPHETDAYEVEAAAELAFEVPR